MDILITGTDGFIGGNLKEFFSRRGHRVTGTVFRREPGPEEVRIDLEERDPLSCLRGREFPVIIHTAGIVDQNVPKKIMFRVNAGGTRKLLEFAASCGCGHFIQTSSVSVYGVRTMGENRTEMTSRCRFSPLAIPYMKSKALAERYIERSGVPYTMLRLPAVLGRNDSALSEAIIPRLLSRTFAFCGKRDPLVSILCVKNLGPIIEKMMDAGPSNDYFNCADFHVRWKEFTGRYAGLLKVPLPEARASIFSIITEYRDKGHLLMVTFSRFGAHYPTAKLESRIALSPETDWRDAVKDAVEGFIDSGRLI